MVREAPPQGKLQSDTKSVAWRRKDKKVQGEASTRERGGHEIKCRALLVAVRGLSFLPEQPCPVNRHWKW